MLGNPINRLEFIAKRVPSFSTPDGQPTADYWALFETVQAFLLATGGDDLARELERAVDSPTPPSMGAIFQAIRDAGIGDTPFDGLIPWFYREIRRSGDENVIAELKRLGAAITQWQRKTRTDLGKLRAETVINAVNEWIAESALATPAKYRGRVVYAFPNGWTVQELRDSDALKEEGDGQHMNHCVGTFCDKVAQGTSVIYSLRDRRNVPHVTMEWQPSNNRYGGHFGQIYGPGNAKPDPALRPYLVEFIQRVCREEPVGLLLTGVPASDLDLRGADLRGTDLWKMDLRSARLEDAWLEGAELWKAQLQGAQLQGAKLQGAILQGAQLQGAQLQGAQLQEAQLQEAQLQGAGLQGAQLQGAGLQRAQLQDAQLQGAQLWHARLWDAQLQDAQLQDAQLQGTELWRAQLQGAQLQGARLQGAQLWYAELQGAQLQGVDLHRAELQGAQLQGAQLQGAQLQGAQLQRAGLQYADLTNATIDKATNFTDAIFEDTTMPDGSRYTGVGWPPTRKRRRR